MQQMPTILYIEDNFDNQRLVQRVLETRGYRVVLAEDGPAGLAAARESRPALVLVDLNIPGLNGFETTTRLRSLPQLNDTPIIALTADVTPGARERALIAGCDGYLAKPIDARRLPGQIGEFIAGKREVVPETEQNYLLREYSQSLVERLEQQVRELSLANAELQELDRLKSQFLSTLSHELRTPLTALSGYLELFSRGTLGQLSPAQDEAVQVMQRSTEILSRQLNNLLYLQELRSHQLARAPVELYGLVQALLTQVRPQIEKTGLQLIEQLLVVAPLDADPAAIELAVRNLLDNAMKFNRPAGCITVSLVDEPGQAILRIEDTGYGIPAEVQTKIFLPFFQVDQSLARPYAGSGIGLTIVQHIIEAHGGQVMLRSKPDQGSTFTLILPRRAAES